jgi:Rho termination factor, N-terminal domain
MKLKKNGDQFDVLVTKCNFYLQKALILLVVVFFSSYQLLLDEPTTMTFSLSSGILVKKTAIPPFLCRDLLLKSKCPPYYQSLARVPLPLVCKASGSNNDWRKPTHRKKSYQGPPPPSRGKFKNYQDQDDLLETSQILSLENGRYTTSDAPTHPKSANPADIVRLFRKHLPQLRETTQNRPGNSNQPHGLNATPLNRDEEDQEIFKKLLKLLKASGTTQEKQANNIDTKGKALKYEKAAVEDSENDITDEDSDFDNDAPDMLDSELEPLTSSRRPSMFSRQSSIPVAKNETVMPSETRRGETQTLTKEEKSDSKALLYESESDSEVEEEPVSEFFVYESEDESVTEEKSELELTVCESVDGQSEGPQEEKIEDLSALTMSELKEIAKSRGLKGYSKLKKADLLERLSSS